MKHVFGHADVFETRRAEEGDIDALIMLRRLLLSDGDTHYAVKTAVEDATWQQNYQSWLAKHIRACTEHICVVVTREISGRVVACATGIIDDRAPMPGCMNGMMGWVQSVVVAPEFRKQGFGRRTMNFLIHWFDLHQVGKIALQTTADAHPLYEQLKFSSTGEDLLIRSNK